MSPLSLGDAECHLTNFFGRIRHYIFGVVPILSSPFVLLQEGQRAANSLTELVSKLNNICPLLMATCHSSVPHPHLLQLQESSQLPNDY